MKIRKILVVVFALIGSVAYADSNKTSVETGATEVEKLRIHVETLKKELALKNKEIRIIKEEKAVVSEVSRTLEYKFIQLTNRYYPLIEENDRLRTKIINLTKKLGTFLGD